MVRARAPGMGDRAPGRPRRAAAAGSARTAYWRIRGHHQPGSGRVPRDVHPGMAPAAAALGLQLPRHAAPLASQHTAATSPDGLADAGFRALKLGNWLSTPDGQLVTDAIEMLAPRPTPRTPSSWPRRSSSRPAAAGDADQDRRRHRHRRRGYRHGASGGASVSAKRAGYTKGTPLRWLAQGPREAGGDVHGQGDDRAP